MKEPLRFRPVLMGVGKLVSINLPDARQEEVRFEHSGNNPLRDLGYYGEMENWVQAWFEVLNRSTPLPVNLFLQLGKHEEKMAWLKARRRGERVNRTQRMQFYIGDNQVIPVIESLVPGWKYAELEEMLGRELPRSSGFAGKVEREQFEFARSLSQAMAGYRKLTESYNQLMIRGDDPEALADRVCVELNWSTPVTEARESLNGLLEVAKDRGYAGSKSEVRGKAGNGGYLVYRLGELIEEAQRVYGLPVEGARSGERKRPLGLPEGGGSRLPGGGLVPVTDMAD